MEVAWFDAEDWERDYLADRNVPFDIRFIEEPLGRDTVDRAAGADAVAVFVPSSVTADVLADLDANVVACRSTGYDHVDIA
ncbi:MAG: 2-hydroxyacid dehydrogenase, partial [Candidatus Nanohaloarchaea archaeon]